MENMQKALIMAGSVFMFVIAISVAIYSYSTVTDVVESIMTSSEYNDRSSEYFIENSLDVTRTITKAEVINTLLSMADVDFTADGIVVGEMVFKKSDFSTYAGRRGIENAIAGITVANYTISYDFTRVPNEIYVVFTVDLAS